MKRTRRLTGDEAVEVATLYRFDKLGIDVLALRFRTSHVAIREALAAQGVTIRPRGRPRGVPHPPGAIMRREDYPTTPAPRMVKLT